jgi:hypothetical protein
MLFNCEQVSAGLNPGSVTASKLNVSSLSAISASMPTIEDSSP